MQNRLWSAALGVAVLVTVASPAIAAAPATAPGTTAPATVVAAADPATAERSIVQSTNQLRAREGRTALVRNGALDTVARSWASRMATSGSFSHNPDVGSQIPAGWRTWGENIAWNTTDPVALSTQWENSPGHRANMVNPAFTDIGVGVVQHGGRYYGVQVFAGYERIPLPAPVAPAGQLNLYRFFQPATGTHFYTASTSERDSVATNPAYQYEGTIGRLLAPTNDPAGTRPLNRFYSPGTGTHFYTATESEYQRVRGLPQYRLDGVVGRTYSSAQPGTVAMHRFFRPSTGTHFYSANAAEIASVKTMPEYQYEGVAFFMRSMS
jgi:uncharacterized protein YkwD